MPAFFFLAGCKLYSQILPVFVSLNRKGTSFLGDAPVVFFGTPGPIRTGDLRIRSPALYPAELRAQENGVSEGT